MERVNRVAIGLVLAWFVSLSRPGSAGVFWKTAIDAPLSPNVSLILGDESRTLAFDGSGVSGSGAYESVVYEFDGFSWHATLLFDEAGAETVLPEGTPFFRAGRFFVLAQEATRTRLLRLEGDTWRTFFESGPIDAFAVGATRLFVASGGFNDCQYDAAACPAPPPGMRIFSVGLTDGSRRQEPPLPACSGEIQAAADVLYLRALRPECASPSARRSEFLGPQRYGDASVPLYRLDGEHWTQVPTLDTPGGYGVFVTDHDLWVVYSISSIDQEIRRLTSSGLSAPVLLPRVNYLRTAGFFEWNGALLYATTDWLNPLFRLSGGAFQAIVPSPAPSSPDSRIYVAGGRIFLATPGSDVHLLGGNVWSATPGIRGSARADRFLVSDDALFAVRGAEIWKREAGDWVRLPRPPLTLNVPIGFVFQGKPVLVETSRFLTFDGFGWVDLGLVVKNAAFFESVAPLLVRPDEFWISSSIENLTRYRGGTVSIYSNPTPLHGFDNPETAHVRDLGGEVVVFGQGGRAYRVQNELLVPAFPDLSDTSLFDGATVNGRTYLLVQKEPGSGPPRPVLLESTPGGYRTIVTTEDYSRGLLQKRGEDFLAAQGGSLLFGGLALTGERLVAQRADQARFTLDPSGRFSTSRVEDFAFQGVRVDRLLLPVSRVRKTIPAAVDAIGVGGLRYRTTLLLANFSPSRACVAHVLPGAASSPAFDVPLAPGRQVRLEDPVPGFVGPLKIEFEGLDDDSNAFAAARVWNPAGAGTAGAVLAGRDSGSVVGPTPLLPPAERAGSRLHMAVSAAADGANQDLSTFDYGTDPVTSVRVPTGTLFQTDPTRTNLQSVLYVTSFFDPPSDDLLGYCVRNDPGANDVTIVAAEPPGLVEGQLVRFLPAAVSVTSAYATYRTELSLGRAAANVYPPKRATYTVTWRSARPAAASSFPVDLDDGEVLHIPDVIAWVGAHGVPVTDQVEGTLTFGSDDPEGASALFANAVVLAKPIGSTAEYGTSVPAFAEGRWARTRAVVPGLLESDTFRSNVAVANPEPAGGPATTLAVSFRAPDGSSLGSLPAVTLQPGERRQFNRPLAGNAIAAGGAYAVVTRVAGEGRFVAYGVVNDNATGSGSLFEMTRAE
jgi:hypothetical protein